MTTQLAKKQEAPPTQMPDHQVVVTFSKQDAKVVFTEGLWTRSQVEIAYRAMIRELRTHMASRRREDERQRTES